MQAADSAVIYSADHNMSADKKNAAVLPVAAGSTILMKIDACVWGTKRLQQVVRKQLYLSGRQLVAGGNNF